MLRNTSWDQVEAFCSGFQYDHEAHTTRKLGPSENTWDLHFPHTWDNSKLRKAIRFLNENLSPRWSDHKSHYYPKTSSHNSDESVVRTSHWKAMSEGIVQWYKAAPGLKIEVQLTDSTEEISQSQIEKFFTAPRIGTITQPPPLKHRFIWHCHNRLVNELGPHLNTQSFSSFPEVSWQTPPKKFLNLRSKNSPLYLKLAYSHRPHHSSTFMDWVGTVFKYPVHPNFLFRFRLCKQRNFYQFMVMKFSTEGARAVLSSKKFLQT